MSFMTISRMMGTNPYQKTGDAAPATGKKNLVSDR